MADSITSKTVLGTDCRIKGELHLDGDLQLHGRCEGSIHISGTLDLRETASVSGLARAGAVRVAGAFDGDLVGEQGIALLEGSRVSGRIFAPRLLAVKGATLRAVVCIGPMALSEAPGQPAQTSAAMNPGIEAPKAAERHDDSLAEFEPVIAQNLDGPETPESDESQEHEELHTAVSVAAALDDADERNHETSPPPSALDSSAQEDADVTTVPQSIRAVLQRRPRLTNLASQGRRSA